VATDLADGLVDDPQVVGHLLAIGVLLVNHLLLHLELSKHLVNTGNLLHHMLVLHLLLRLSILHVVGMSLSQN
jgi:hypothetical protein